MSPCWCCGSSLGDCDCSIFTDDEANCVDCVALVDAEEAKPEQGGE